MSKRPLGAKIIVTPEETEEKKIGSIIVPVSVSNFFKSGIVKGVGKAASDSVKEGERVFFPKNAGRQCDTLTTDLAMTEDDLWWVED